MWSILTPVGLAIFGVATGWVSAKRQRSWKIRSAVLVLMALATYAHEEAARRELDYKYTVTVRGARFLGSLLDLLQGAQSEIYIAAPFVAYGDFSQPQFFTKFRTLLKQKHDSDQVKIFMFVPERAKRLQRLRQEFQFRWDAYQVFLKKGTVSEDITRKLPETPAEFAAKLTNYCNWLGVREKPSTFDDLITLLMKDEDDVQAQVTHDSVVQSIQPEGDVPFTLWAVDRTQAAFTDERSSTAFVTQDGRITRFLISAVESTKSSSEGSQSALSSWTRLRLRSRSPVVRE
jgi:hypothetical protein